MSKARSRSTSEVTWELLVADGSGAAMNPEGLLAVSVLRDGARTFSARIERSKMELPELKADDRVEVERMFPLYPSGPLDVADDEVRVDWTGRTVTVVLRAWTPVSISPPFSGAFDSGSFSFYLELSDRSELVFALASGEAAAFPVPAGLKVVSGIWVRHLGPIGETGPVELSSGLSNVRCVIEADRTK